MRRKILLIGLMAGYCSIAIAQDKEAAAPKRSCSCGFNSILNFGHMEGSEGSAFLVQTINGFRYKTWFLGAGVGLDFYHLRGVPVFVDLRKELLKKPGTPFLYVDYGIHYAWARDKDITFVYRGTNEFLNGAFYDFGLGYQARIKNNNVLLFSLGYSYKYVREKIVSPGYCPGNDCPDQVEWYRYRLNRLTLKAGWRF